MLPAANIDCERLPKNADITLEGKVNQSYVYTAPNGDRAVVTMTGHKQLAQQTQLDGMVRATARRKAKAKK